MSIPKEPRQMMINMMYLVLTALLAMNISAEVLNAFTTVRDGIEITNAALDRSTDEVINAFKSRAKQDSAAIDLYEKALAAKLVADNLYSYIEMVKDSLIESSGATTDSTGKKVMANPRDTHAPTLFMLNEGRAPILKAKIEEAQKKFVEIYPEELRKERLANMTLRADAPPIKKGEVPKTWEINNFNEVPTTAAVTLLAKMQNDVRTTESAVIEYLKSQVGINNIEFDQLKGRSFPKKSYLNLGESYEADIFVSASSSSTKPKVYVGQLDMEKIGKDENGIANVVFEGTEPPLIGTFQTLDPPNEQGIVKYTVTPNRVGPQKYSGVIEILNAKTGNKTFYPFEEEYLVAQSQAVVSPTKMNVLYIGVPNPIEISVPGYASPDVQASLSAGSLRNLGSGKYEANVLKPGDIKVNVSVKTETGSRVIGQKDFRVKRIPDPKVKLGNRTGPIIKAGELGAFPGLIAVADNFPFDVRFQVKGFTVTYKKAGSSNLSIIRNTGNIFSEDLKSVFKRAKPGDRVWFDDIKVLAPDKTTRVVNLSFKVVGG